MLLFCLFVRFSVSVTAVGSALTVFVDLAFLSAFCRPTSLHAGHYLSQISLIHDSRRSDLVRQSRASMM